MLLLAAAAATGVRCKNGSVRDSSVDAGHTVDLAVRDVAPPERQAARDRRPLDGPQCDAPRTACNGYCVDLSADISNCGKCGNTCRPGRGEVCHAGSCVCAAGTAMCNDSCVNTMADKANCGACGVACGASCISGACLDFFDCGAGLTDIKQDSLNCGRCGDVCSVCQPTMCGLPYFGPVCGIVLVSTDTDMNNCGTCDHKCTGGLFCANGMCGSEPCPGTLCQGICVDLAIDNRHCGACLNACDQRRGFLCKNSQCTCAYPGMTVCGNQCVWTDGYDPSNCGACGKRCIGPKRCNKGICACDPKIPDDCGSCTNLQWDPLNCGACGKACLPGEVCQSGICGPP